MGALVVERAGAGVVVRSRDSRVPRPRLAPKITSANDGRVRVFVDQSALGDFDLLDSRVMADLEAQLRPGHVGRTPDIRLLAGRTGSAGSNGQAPLAARLSERLNVEVVAPDGNLLMLPGGELFSLGDAAGWVGFQHGRCNIDSGPRHPGPVWQDALTEALRTLPTDARISVVQVPAGLWVRSAGKPPRPASDMAFRVPVHASRPAILVGAPGEEPPEVMALAGLIASLPPRLRETFGLIGCGPEPVRTTSWARRIADILGIQVSGCHALPQYFSDGTTTWQTLDGTGNPSWRPFVLESTYRPGKPPIPHNYVPPVPGMPEAGKGTYRLQGDWLLDVVPSGMLVRSARKPADPVAVELAYDPHVVNLVVAGDGGPPPAPVLASIERLAAALAPEVRSRLRLLTPPNGDPGHLAQLAARLNVGVHVLGASGPGPAVSPHALNSGEVRSTTESSEGMDQSTRRLSSVPVQPGAAEQEPGTYRARPPVPVMVGADGRMRPVGDGWRRDDAATPSTVDGDAATAGADPASLPSTSASVRVPTVASSATPRGADSVVATGKPSAPAASTTSLEVPTAPPAPAASAAQPTPSAAPQAAVATANVAPAAQRLKPAEAGSAAPPVTRAVPAATAPHVPASVAVDTELEPQDSVAAAAVEAPVAQLATGASAAPPTTQPAGSQVGEQRARTAVANQETQTPQASESGAEVAETPAAAAEPADTGEPAAAAVGDAVRRGRPLLLTDHVSTAEDRLQFRKSLGWRYDAATQSVSRLLAERPGLRGGAAIDDAMMTELAAIHVFATSDQAEAIEAVRSGDADQHYPLLSCLAGGLRRLPSVQGLVVRGGPEIMAAAGDYTVGADLLEPAPLMGVADAEVPVPGGVEVLVWSLSGRRIGGLADGIHASDVMFLPATVFRVLAVETEPASPRVLLTEIKPGRQRSQEAQQRHDAKILARLRDVAQNREGVPAGEFSDEHRARHAVLPGSPSQPFAMPEMEGAR